MPASRRSVGFALFAFLLSLYLLTGSGHLHSIDDAIQLSVAESIVEQRSLEAKYIRDNPARPAADKKYSKYGIGQSLLYVPFVIAGNLTARIYPRRTAHQFTVFYASFLNALLSALTCWVLFLLAADLGISLRASALLALIHGTTTIQWPYAHDAFNMTATGLALLACLTLLRRGRADDNHRLILLAGCALAGGILTRLTLVLALPGICLFLLSERLWLNLAAVRRLAALLLPIALAALLILGLNWFKYGGPFQSGYEGEVPFDTPLWLGLAGFLFSSGKSIFLYSPVLLVAIVAFGRLLESDRRFAVLTHGTVLVFLLFYSRLDYWHGDWAWGPRYAVPWTALLILPLGFVLGRWQQLSKAKRSAIILLVATGFTIQTVAIAIDYQVQMELMQEQGNMDKRLWRPGHSPLVVQARTCLQVLRGTAPYPNRPRDFDSGRPRENTFDLWWVYMWKLGVARKLVVAALLLLVTLTLLAGVALARQLSAGHQGCDDGRQ